MKQIKLTQGKYAIVDDEDFAWLNQWKWFVVECSNKFYAGRHQWIGVINKKKVSKRIYMHREVLQAKKGSEIDHKDGNSLNNQKLNLRIATRSQNAMNRGKQINNKTGFKGVTLLKDQPRNKKYLSTIRINQRNICLGVFLTKEDAAQTYNEAAKKYFGEFAYLNQVGGIIR